MSSTVSMEPVASSAIEDGLRPCPGCGYMIPENLVVCWRCGELIGENRRENSDS